MDMPFSQGSVRFPGVRCKDGQTPPRGARLYHQQPTFCVVRHPLSRIVSIVKFNHMLQHARGRSKNHHPDYLRAKNRTEVAVKMNSLLRDIIDWLDDQPRNQTHSLEESSVGEDELEKTRPPCNPCHLIPQVDYIWDEAGKRTCSYVLRFERLEEDFNALLRLYGRRVQLMERNRRSNSKSSLGKFSQHVSAIDNKYNAFSIDDVDETNLEALLRLYQDDFCLLGYSSLNFSTSEIRPLLGSSTLGQWENFVRCAYEVDRRVSLDAV